MLAGLPPLALSVVADVKELWHWLSSVSEKALCFKFLYFPMFFFFFFSKPEVTYANSP